MTTQRAIWAVAAIAALLTALALALSPVSVHGVACGTPLASKHIEITEGTDGYLVDDGQCGQALSQRRTYAAGLGILGAIILVGALSNARWTKIPLHELGRPVTR